MGSYSYVVIKNIKEQMPFFAIATANSKLVSITTIIDSQ